MNDKPILKTKSVLPDHDIDFDKLDWDNCCTLKQLEKQNKREAYQDVSRSLKQAAEDVYDAARYLIRLEEYERANDVKKLSIRLDFKALELEVKNENKST